MSDLIERLRIVIGGTVEERRVREQAADEIEGLTALDKASKAAESEWISTVDSLTAANVRLTEQRDWREKRLREYEAERERLRAALYPFKKLAYDQTPRELGMSIEALRRANKALQGNSDE